jgi:hypothetical protein
MRHLFASWENGRRFLHFQENSMMIVANTDTKVCPVLLKNGNHLGTSAETVKLRAVLKGCGDR